MRAQERLQGTHRRYQETVCQATSSKTCEHNVGIDYIIVGINICAVVILSCCLFSLIGRYIHRLHRRYNSTEVGVRERGAQVDRSLYIGQKRNSNQSINPIQDSGLDPAGSGEVSSSTMPMLVVLVVEL